MSDYADMATAELVQWGMILNEHIETTEKNLQTMIRNYNEVLGILAERGAAGEFTDEVR